MIGDGLRWQFGISRRPNPSLIRVRMARKQMLEIPHAGPLDKMTAGVVGEATCQGQSGWGFPKARIWLLTTTLSLFQANEEAPVEGS